MRRALVPLAMIAAALALPAAANASFGFLPGKAGFEAVAVEENGSPDLRAGTHPSEVKVHLALNQAPDLPGEPGVPVTDGDLRDLHLALPSGLLFNPSAIHECTQADFHTPRVSPFQQSLSGESCPDTSQLGVVAIHSNYGGRDSTYYFGVYNLEPPYGSPGAIGFSPFGIPIEITSHIRESDAAMVLDLEKLSQRVDINAIDLTLWGTPGDGPLGPKEEVSTAVEGDGTIVRKFQRVFERDNERGNCLNEENPAEPFGVPGKQIITVKEKPGHQPETSTGYEAGTCSAGNPLEFPPHSYLSMPTSCSAPTVWGLSARSWQNPPFVEDSFQGPTMQSCRKSHTVAGLRLMTDSAASPTGVRFNLEISDGGGLLNQEGIVTSPAQKAVVSLPEGLTINPSVGAGLGVCTPADFARETISTPPGAGCPNNSKLGDVEVEGLTGLERPVGGAVFLAAPYDNPFGSLIGLYIVVSDPERGLFDKAVGKIEADPHNGQLTSTFENLPRLHYTNFSITFREGQRSLMVSPSVCGTYTTQAYLNPWSEPETVIHDEPSFKITNGEAGGLCPTGALAPFHPQLEAGSINPQAGAYTPFYLHMTRTNAEQEITSYSATFPKGLLGKIAGIPYCPDADIEAAKLKTGLAELAAPSCPAASKIGRTLAGYGVSGTLAYAPGGLYLAGPYHGSTISIVAIDSALVGPFDLGVVIVRSAIRLDPQSAQPFLDSSGSDPIPHIIKGIPIHLRDIRVYLDRPGFMLNPTNCDPLQSLSTLTGAGADVFSRADDVAATAADRYQVANCSALGFSPHFAMTLKGSTKRGGFPSLRATYMPRPGDANIGQAVVALPHTEFLAQSHIREICPARLFAAQNCPASSIYGHVRAVTPLLAEPLEGPVYLRSSSVHPLPDLVAVLHQGSLEVDLVGRVDSTKAGGMRGSFEILPDAPVSKFELTLQGGKKGLLENSANLCAEPSYASARFIAQDNATDVLAVKMGTDCKKRHGAHKKGGRR